MLIPSIIPSALHFHDHVGRVTKGTDVDDVASQKSYPATNGNPKMADATTIQHDETQSTHHDNSPLTTGVNDYSFRKKRNSNAALNNQSSHGEGISIMLQNMN